MGHNSWVIFYELYDQCIDIAKIMKAESTVNLCCMNMNKLASKIHHCISFNLHTDFSIFFSTPLTLLAMSRICEIFDI